MKILVLTLYLTLGSTALPAQLTPTTGPGGNQLTLTTDHPIFVFSRRLMLPVTDLRAGPQGQGQGVSSPRLVYPKPHLAFFCRLEINEARGGSIPMKFRLGGPREPTIPRVE